MATTQTIRAITLATDSETYHIELTGDGLINVRGHSSIITASAAELLEIAKVAQRLEGQLDD